MAALLGEYTGNYSSYTPLYAEQARYYRILGGGTDCDLTVSQTSLTSTITRRVAFEPVYVAEVDGEERLAYDPNMMEPDKKYPVTWLGKRLTLIKTGSKVSICRSGPEK